MHAERGDGTASGFICPVCGGSLWERPSADGDVRGAEESGALHFKCRVGHRFEEAQLWIEHCAARNRALQRAARSLAENAALARRLAIWTRAQGNPAAAEELEREAAQEEELFEQVRQMVEGLPESGGMARPDT